MQRVLNIGLGLIVLIAAAAAGVAIFISQFECFKEVTCLWNGSMRFKPYAFEQILNEKHEMELTYNVKKKVRILFNGLWYIKPQS